jgi:RNA polymerase-binding transcription factor DksA
LSLNRTLAQRSLETLAKHLADRRDTALEMAERFLDEALENQATADHSDRLDPASPTGVSSEESYALATHARKAALEAELALRRIAEGTFGICAGWGTDIPFARLHALPAATLCVACAGRARRQGSDLISSQPGGLR